MDKLTPKEIKDLVRLLKKVSLPAPYPIFIALCRSVPMVAINVAVMPDKERILLTHRKDDFYDNWHIPGSILCYKESPKDAIDRVCREELSLKAGKPRFVGYFNEYDGRGHVLVLLYAVRPVKEPKIGTYFKVDKFPADLIKCQRKEIEHLNKIKNL